MRIAAAQFEPVPGDVGANVRAMAELVRTAAGQGARLVVFPELSTTGYFLTLLAHDPALALSPDEGDEGDARLAPLREACRETATAAVVNAAVRTPSGLPTISSLVLAPDGTLLTRYDKQHLHGVENDLFVAGTRDGHFTLDGVGFALAVCYDNRFPALAARARAAGATAYLASSVLERGNDSFESVYPVRARDNGLYVLLANTVGTNEGGSCAGASGAWSPDGSLLTTAGEESPGCVTVDLV
ncbi:carbon-nitrogen hydrolase family protein [Streptomyces sp. NPDC048057]|uniref:carbon-nitrogen hydrolase family protein n=1 Tax=Streptomyces sp. NPDC048057 TaxID=3155628 RepID=UPI0033C8CB04